MSDCLFCKIRDGEIPGDKIYENDDIIAIKDVNPQAPVHILIIPNKLIPTVADVKEEDEVVLGHLITVAAKIARDEGIDGDGYRLLINCKDHGGQEVYHLHMHLFGGRPLGPMLAR